MTAPGEHGSPPSDDELDPDEPKTPLWLPLLGLALFVAAFTWLVAGRAEAPKAEGEAPAPSASGAH